MVHFKIMVLWPRQPEIRNPVVRVAGGKKSENFLRDDNRERES
jgi:hypothetical protein